MDEARTSAPSAALVPAGGLHHLAAGRPSLGRRLWLATAAGFAAVMGLLPHVLHHVGPLAGAALLGGVSGSLLFGVLGFLAAIPFLLRLHRRSGGWRTPVIVLALFAVVFTVSTFVVGPAIRGDGGDAPPAGRSPAAPSSPNAPPNGSGHESHHD